MKRRTHTAPFFSFLLRRADFTTANVPENERGHSDRTSTNGAYICAWKALPCIYLLPAVRRTHGFFGETVDNDIRSADAPVGGQQLILSNVIVKTRIKPERCRIDKTRNSQVQRRSNAVPRRYHAKFYLKYKKFTRTCEYSLCPVRAPARPRFSSGLSLNKEFLY
jgi:hypothetical protein